MPIEVATFAAGCFWGVEDAFRQYPGVRETMVGYTGGHTSNPTYEAVCRDLTGHAEAVQIRFDSDEIAYEELLRLFWDLHDPTTLNRQGPDIGSQYRSAIFYHSPQQQQAAQASISQAQRRYTQPIVTQLLPASVFHRAEEYHQQYNARHGRHCNF